MESVKTFSSLCLSFHPISLSAGWCYKSNFEVWLRSSGFGITVVLGLVLSAVTSVYTLAKLVQKWLPRICLLPTFQFTDEMKMQGQRSHHTWHQKYVDHGSERRLEIYGPRN